MLTTAEGEFLERFAEAMLVDIAGEPEDAPVEIGAMLIELFDAEARGMDYDDDLPHLTLTVGALRLKLRDLIEQLARESSYRPT